MVFDSFFCRTIIHNPQERSALFSVRAYNENVFVVVLYSQMVLSRKHEVMKCNTLSLKEISKKSFILELLKNF